MRLPLSFQQNKIHYKNYLLLLVICVLAYWPLTFGVFSVKNDAIHYFLPYRFHISEAIRNGEFPFWSPYIYLGNPVYGDMQSGAWNPFVWLFSLTGRYDVTLFHYENLLYIFLAGVGMYKLTNRLTGHTRTSLLIACSYMLSGFMLSGQLINWLAAAAFIPFVFNYYLQTLRSRSLSNPVKTAIALFFLLTAGYPSFFIITSYVLLAGFIIILVRRFNNKQNVLVSWKRFSLQHLVILLVFAGLSLPAIISFIDLLPYYQRGSGASYAEVVINSFEWQHSLSLIFPSAIKASTITSTTDVTLRNIYPGLFALLVLVICPPRINRRNIFLLSMAIFAFLFSLGDATPLRKICYEVVPFMNTFRHPSQMRLFFIFAILLLTAPGLKRILEEKIRSSGIRKMKTITWGAIFIILIITLLSFFKSSTPVSGFSLSGIKQLIDNMSLADTLFINGILQLFFLLLFQLWTRKYFHQKKIFAVLWITNLVVFAQLILPVTFVSQTSPREINAFIHASPKGFPASGLDRSLGYNSRDILDHFDKIALASFYNKKIGISRISNSPAFLDEQDSFLQSRLLYDYVAAKPVMYLADSVMSIKDTSLLNNNRPCSYAFTDLPVVVADTCAAGHDVIIKELSANHFEIETRSASTCMLVLTQSYHHHWKVWVDDKKSSIYKVNTGFMGTPLPAGHHSVVFRFVPVNTIIGLWILLATFIFLTIAGVLSLLKNSNRYQA